MLFSVLSAFADTQFLDSILLTLVSMILTAIYVYLPDHIRTIYGHLYYYWVGERPFVSSSLAAITTAFRDSGTQTLEVMYETAQGTAAAGATTVPEL